MDCTKRRIGIYAGTFDPVHAGHVSFALLAQQRAYLDEVYFMPERLPRYKRDVAHFAHRVHMLTQALRPYPSLKVLELPDKNFSVIRVLPQLRAQFPDAQIVFLWGSDNVFQMARWEHIDRLAQAGEHIVSVRGEDSIACVEMAANDCGIAPQSLMILDSLYPDVGSRHIRKALATDEPEPGLLESTKVYAKRQWLYATMASKKIVDNR